uniref:Fucosyltransferase n=1 Tax=Timema poppense TaxID=170557 RepID=A0A7R9CPZ0_TIMPO|nr:unnamed protein product [Timema poppensis]
MVHRENKITNPLRWPHGPRRHSHIRLDCCRWGDRGSNLSQICIDMGFISSEKMSEVIPHNIGGEGGEGERLGKVWRREEGRSNWVYMLPWVVKEKGWALGLYPLCLNTRARLTLYSRLPDVVLILINIDSDKPHQIQSFTRYKEPLRFYSSVSSFVRTQLSLTRFQNHCFTDKLCKSRGSYQGPLDLLPGIPLNYRGQSPFLEAGCPVTNCFLSNREYVTTNVDDFDAILFHLWLYPSEGDEIMDELIVNTERYSIVYPRKPHQRYVLFLLEPPGTYLSNLKDLPNFFNWTMTYRHDSDIYRPYGYFRPLNGSSKMVDPRETPVRWKQPTMSSDALEEYLNLSKRKTKLVAWFVSKCRTQGKREEFVEDLKKYVQVDVYGSCGSMSCSRSRGGECFQMLDQDYKFYLSFENSLCQDYVTEKLFSFYCEIDALNNV